MGKKAKAYGGAIASAQTAIGQRNIQATQAEQQFREQQLSLMSRYLGTEEQIRGDTAAGYGTFGGIDYAGRYSIDPAIMGAYTTAMGIRPDPALQAYYGDRLSGGIERAYGDQAGISRAARALGSLGIELHTDAPSGTYETQTPVGVFFSESQKLGVSGKEDAWRIIQDYGHNISRERFEQAWESVGAEGVAHDVMSNVQGATGGGYAQLIREDIDRANGLLEDAQAAAEAGDMGRANQLKAEADAIVKGIPTIGGITGEDLFRMSGSMSAEEAAKQQLSSPLAQSVGQLVKAGRGFLDRESTESQEFRKSLTAGAEEAIAFGRGRQLGQIRGGLRSAQRAQRDIALQRGGGRMLGAESALATRVSETATEASRDVEAQATSQRVQVVSDAAKFFETFRLQFAQDIAGFAQGWLQNEAGVRDEYLNRMTQTGMAAAQYAQQAANQALGFAAQEMAIAAGQPSAQGQAGQALGGVIGTVLGGVVGSLFGGVGAPVGAAAGGAAGTAIGGLV